MRPATVSPSSIRNRSGPALPSTVTVTSMRARPPDPAGATFPRADSALPSFIIVGGRATAKSEQIQLKSKNCLTFFFSLCFLARRGRTHDQKKKNQAGESSRIESTKSCARCALVAGDEAFTGRGRCSGGASPACSNRSCGRRPSPAAAGRRGRSCGLPPFTRRARLRAERSGDGLRFCGGRVGRRTARRRG